MGFNRYIILSTIVEQKGVHNNMALIPCGYTKDEYGRTVAYSIDTDDLDDAEYHYYCKARDLRNKVAGALKTAREILLGELRASEIEHNPKYSWLAD